MVCRLVSRGGEPGGPQEVVWEGDSRWIPISAALLGEVGRMQVLTPSVLVHPTDEDSSQVRCHTTANISLLSADCSCLKPRQARICKSSPPLCLSTLWMNTPARYAVSLLQVLLVFLLTAHASTCINWASPHPLCACPSCGRPTQSGMLSHYCESFNFFC